MLQKVLEPNLNLLGIISSNDISLDNVKWSGMISGVNGPLFTRAKSALLIPNVTNGFSASQPFIFLSWDFTSHPWCSAGRRDRDDLIKTFIKKLVNCAVWWVTCGFVFTTAAESHEWLASSNWQNSCSRLSPINCTENAVFSRKLWTTTKRPNFWVQNCN